MWAGARHAAGLFHRRLPFRLVCSGGCSLLRVHPDFDTLPRLRSARQPGPGKRFSLSLLLLAPLCPDIHVSLTLDPLLHSASSDILQKPLFNAWLPHSVWPYIPWRHSHVSDGWDVSELPGACSLWTTTWITVAYPGLSVLTSVCCCFPWWRLCPPRLGCPRDAGEMHQCRAPPTAFAFLKANIVAHPERCNLGKEPLL